MHRTQVNLPDEMYARVKSQAERADVSVSEFIRRLVEKGMDKNPVVEAQAFFDQLKPLDSFAEVDPEAYVRELRGNSRINRLERDD